MFWEARKVWNFQTVGFETTFVVESISLMPTISTFLQKVSYLNRYSSFTIATIRSNFVKWLRFYSCLGSDSNPGTITRPFATIQRAQQEVRIKKLSWRGPINVFLREGYYFVNSTITLTPEDSGNSADEMITYSGYPSETAVLSGGLSWMWHFFFVLWLPTTEISTSLMKALSSCVRSGNHFLFDILHDLLTVISKDK